MRRRFSPTRSGSSDSRSRVGEWYGACDHLPTRDAWTLSVRGGSSAQPGVLSSSHQLQGCLPHAPHRDSPPESASEADPPLTINVVSAPFRSYVLVSREQIGSSFRHVRSVVGPHVEVACVVKADAYGHGALEVARVLCAEGANWLAVS